MLRHASRSVAKISSQTACVLLMITLFGTQSAFAEMQIKENGKGFDVLVFGTITALDAAALERHESQLSYTRPTVLLNSRGGEVDAAMRIGRILRRLEATTMILRDRDECLSSCALIYIAGVHRFGLGTLGIHRPYLASNAARRETVEQATRLMMSSVQAYVRDMGISPNFYDLMIATEPSRMKVFYGQELESLIPEKDPIFDEVTTNYDARKYGVSKVEMRRRQAEANSKCKLETVEDGRRHYSCEQAIYWGLSEGVYERRSKNRADSCPLSEAEKSLVDLVPARLRKDHAIWIKVEDCFRKAMASD